MKTRVCIIACFSMVAALHAQTVSEQEAVAQALGHYPTMQIADHRVRLQKSLERSAFNPDQPQLIFEFPNDVGPAYEFQQEFDFPGVYSSRSKWLKSQTHQVNEAANITRQELIRDVRLAYLDAQAMQMLRNIFTHQDSLWQEIAESTQRLFDGGQINRADFLYASKQAGLVSNWLAAARIDADNALAGLTLYTGENIDSVVTLRMLPFAQSDMTGGYYFDRYLSESKHVAERELAVRKAERLPGLLVGFLRTPELDTDYRYRFNAGVTIPLWQGQYKSEVDAAKIALETVQTETDLQRQQAQIRHQQLLQTLAQTSNALMWFENSALPQMDELTIAYRRLYEGGEVDYALALRNIADAVDVQTQYLETLKRHNQTVIELEFLSGQ